MTIVERAIGTVVVLDISGRLVLDDGDAALKEAVLALLKQGKGHIVLNAAELTYVDSAGLGALVSSFVAAKKEGSALRLLSPSQRLVELLTMARLLPMVDICESEEQAVASFGSAAG
jgi:anti-anti-sigma factor